MRRTLLFIPHEIAGLPVFGLGWLLILIGIALICRAVLAWRRGESLATLAASEGPMWLIAAAAVAWVMPMVELQNIAGEHVGMAIRGYGVMLLAGVASAVLLAWYRARARGIDPDIIFSLAPWVFIGGIVGARLFYVIQYRDHFIADSLGQTLRNMLAFTEGGLVVYGSFIGGFLAAVVFVARHRLPLLRLGDVVVPCLFIGVFFGRIGCLMNGCCYGGRCEDAAYALYFPPGSPVYQEQLRSGELLGLAINPLTRRVESVERDSVASRAGVERGAKVEQIDEFYPDRSDIPRDVPVEKVQPGAVAVINGKLHRWEASELPMRALAVQPAQLISSVGALVLCLSLCAIPAGRHRDGLVMMTGFAGYAVMRFVMEIIRVDEAGQFGTSLSISQWVSLVVFTLSMAGLAVIYLRPAPVSADYQAR